MWLKNSIIFFVGFILVLDGVGSIIVSEASGENRFHRWLNLGRAGRVCLGIVLMMLSFEVAE